MTAHGSSRRVRLLGAALACVVAAALPAAPANAEEPTVAEQAVKAARLARPSVVRIVWRNYARKDDVRERNAVVVSSAGHLLMAGPAPDPFRGELTAEVTDTRSAAPRTGSLFVRVKVVASDPESGLTLLYVHAPGLQPIGLPRAPLPAQVVPLAKDDERPVEAGTAPNALAPTDPKPAKRATGADNLSDKRPLGTLAIGTPVVLVSGDGGVAYGKVRAQDKDIPMRSAATGKLRPVSALVEATLTSLPGDLGAPWVDAEGRLLALQMATGLARAVPEDVARAKTHGLLIRPHPTASRAVPISVIREVLPLLIQRRAVRRGGFGVVVRPATEAVRAHFCDGQGCFEVLAVRPDGPAAAAGLEARDLVVSIQGEPVRPTAEWDDLLLPYRPGERVQIGILRKGAPKRVEVTLAGRRKP